MKITGQTRENCLKDNSELFNHMFKTPLRENILKTVENSGKLSKNLAKKRKTKNFEI